jgi:hypothetical protein
MAARLLSVFFSSRLIFVRFEKTVWDPPRTYRLRLGILPTLLIAAYLHHAWRKLHAFGQVSILVNIAPYFKGLVALVHLLWPH